LAIGDKDSAPGSKSELSKTDKRKISRLEIKKLPSVNEVDGGEDDEGA
jgi:hypothetical protein